MFVMMTPELVAKFWPMVEHAARTVADDGVEDIERMVNNVHAGLLSGDRQCWVSRDNLKGKIKTVVLTHIMEDAASEVRFVIIDCIYGFGMMKHEAWTEANEVMKKWGKARGCKFLAAFTKVPEAVKAAELLGWETDTRFIRVEV